MTARLGILLSGSGSTYANIQEHIDEGFLDAEVVVVISSSPKAYGLERAEGFGHPRHVAREASDVSALLIAAECDLVLMCGWMRFYDPPKELAGKVLNIHPSLLPAFSGKGMYGRHVHAAVVEAGMPMSGCSVHLVQGEYDTGRIIAQRSVQVSPAMSAEEIEFAVQTAERHLYPLVIRSLLAHGLQGGEAGRYWLKAVDGIDGADFGFT